MSELVFGDVNWNDAEVSTGGKGGIDFMRLSEGANVVRVVSNPSQFYIHWLTLPNGSKKKVNTPESKELADKLADAGFRMQKRWFLKVIDRSDNKYKLLEVGSQIFGAIKQLVENKKWGNVSGYDITINRAPKGTQPLYSVQPDPKEPLDSSLKQAYVEFNERLNIERLITPSDTKYICELMGWTLPGTEEVDPMSDDSSEEGFDFSFD